jgi:hypothetical protein
VSRRLAVQMHSGEARKTDSEVDRLAGMIVRSVRREGWRIELGFDEFVCWDKPRLVQVLREKTLNTDHTRTECRFGQQFAD